MKIKATMSCLLLFSFSCRSDKGITVFNPDPEAEITSHSEGDEVLEGYPILLEGHVGDANHSAEQLTVKWKNNGEVLCEASVPQADGSTFCEAIFSASTTKITLEVKDSDGGLGITEPLGLIVVPAQPPVCSISTPLEEGVYYSDQLISFSGSITDAEDNPELLSGFWKSNIDGVLSDVEVTPDALGDVQGYGYLSEGEHAIELHGEDAIGLPCSDSVIINVKKPNTEPTAPVVSIHPDPGNVHTNDLICTVAVDSMDEDGDTLTYQFTWFVDGVPWTGVVDTTNYSSDTILNQDLELGQTWSCEVVASDGMSQSPVGVSSNVLVVQSFEMGSPVTENGRKTDEDQFWVHFTYNFQLEEHETTQDSFVSLMGYNPTLFPECLSCPQDNINWYEAAAYTNQLSITSGLPECYSCTYADPTDVRSITCEISSIYTSVFECSGYRLPTEAEWEYSARAGTTAAIWTPNGGGEIPAGFEYIAGCDDLTWTLSDGTPLDDLGWFCANTESTTGTQPVQQKAPNDWGLYDMSGNLWEWCHDNYGTYPTGEIYNPTGIVQGSKKVFRGGDWAEHPFSLRSARRGSRVPSFSSNRIGFRAARSIQ